MARTVRALPLCGFATTITAAFKSPEIPRMPVVEILFVLLLVLANGFFVAAEFALVKVRLTQIETLAKEGNWSAKIAEKLLGRLDAYLSACQLGITLASLGLGWVGEPVISKWLKPIVTWLGFSETAVDYIAVPLAFVVITFLHITLGEQAPKIVAIHAARSTALVISPPLAIFFKVFWPFIWLLNRVSNLMVRAIGVRVLPNGEQVHATEDELRLMLAESAAGGEVSRRERLMIENVLDLESKVARQIMVPRRNITFLNVRRPIGENMRIVTETRHTRFPVCDGDLDRVIGMLHTKDLLRSVTTGQEITSLAKFARKIPVFPETMRLDVLLREFQRNRTHVAMVVDEYGTVAGMVTFENVLEELVGPIQDEFDRELPQIIRRSQGRYLIDGLCPVDELVEQCHIELPDELAADTTGGLVVELLGHIPEPGEKLRIGRYELTVVEAEPTRVRRVELVDLEPEAGEREDANAEERERLEEADSKSIEPTGRTA
jgi:CBS domain containing-hemolysin-like protein